jgi:serine/threonine protein phosphatase 1
MAFVNLGESANMIDWLKNAPVPRQPSTPDGTRIYAIGDIHGCADAMDSLLATIADDVKQQPARQTIGVFLGDYVDRGAQSCAVLERLAKKAVPMDFVALRGNHEAMLLRFLEEPAYLEEWRGVGGLETLHSYGIDVSAIMRGTGYEQAHDAFATKLPEAHLGFLQATRLSYESADYYFCHAGIRPGVKLADQVESDLLWIRQEFLNCTKPFEKFVVHGHTPVASPDIHANRIGIDTGVYATGVLTCLVLEGSNRRFLASTSE